MPKVVAETDASVWRDIDCMKCANCCKTMTPTFTPKDITRISAHLGMKPHEFKDKWLLKEEDTGDWVNKTATMPVPEEQYVLNIRSAAC